MVVTDAIEGTISSVLGSLWFHYDITSDVLYLRLANARAAETFGEETTDGFLLLRRSSDDLPVGLTVVNWWKRFGTGTLPDSIKELGRSIEPWSTRIAA